MERCGKERAGIKKEWRRMDGEMERTALGLKWNEEMGRKGKGWRQMMRWKGQRRDRQREREWRNGKDRNGMKRYNTIDI